MLLIPLALVLLQTPAPPAQAQPTAAEAAAIARAEAAERLAGQRRPRDPGFAGPGSESILTLGGQGPAEPPPVNLYQPPAIRPYEPAEQIIEAEPAQFLPPTPVPLERYRRDYEAPPAPAEIDYQRGVERAFAAGQRRMGELDGVWRLAPEGPAAGDTYQLVLTDPTPEGGVEGAWRLTSAPPEAQAVGLLMSVGREGRGVLIRFRAPGALAPTEVRLEEIADGQWRGALRDGAGVERRMLMTRGG